MVRFWNATRACVSMTLDDYIHLFGCDVVHWAHVRARVNTSLFDMLQHLQQYDVQILYTNTELLSLLRARLKLCASWYRKGQCGGSTSEKQGSSNGDARHSDAFHTFQCLSSA